ncbi:MAG TPA: hypothetical protein VGB24_09620 [Longimicrobium sp.]|jgi:P pilus assembly chaperone PapD|uniref:hypothetical protein n=1 Tax=Longimicrobium sp. TaxID=2029185 RepID=UPI002ED9045F
MTIARLHRWFAPLALAAVASGCAPKSQPAYIPATSENVRTRLEAGNDGRIQYVVVENRSTVPITVTSVSLRECLNIKSRCEVYRLREAVPPGATRRVFTVRADNPEGEHRFRYGFTWESDQSTPAPPNP